ncbi:diguanylate cyclase [Marinobacter sp. Arc7-DN-1]|uniref:sensor domain-containing diguanylate cyclase n=1 Tax=Marinobacter sp. Arc7-DN-1 TaxID=2304594 RepID=UPI000E43BA89|nr:diguanylate cyclase [Marinobacter sp. Arc7-DN-1]AXS82989.1 diguanylate cyclase [Marinobacter sp. Arc7-DN-1]
MIHIALLVLLALCSAGASATGTPDSFPVVLDEDSGRLDISRHLTYYEDPSSSLNISQIVRRWPQIASVGIPDEAYNFGFTDSTYWFHTRVINSSSPNDRWVIEGLYPIIDEMEVFFVRADGSVGRQIAGDAIPFRQRPKDHHNINFFLKLPTGQSVDLFFRVRTSGAVQMRTLLWNSDDFSSADHQERFLLGLYYGLLVSMAIFNFLIFVSFRDTNYLWYVSYILSYGLLQFTLNGLAFEHLWPESPWWNNRAVAFLIATGMFCVLGFSRSFLALRENAPRLEKVFLSLMVFFVLAGAGALFWPDYGPVIRVNTFMAAVSVGFVILAGGLCLYRRFRPARYFMVAWTALLSGMLLYTLKTFALVPANFLTEFGIQIGSAFEVILLSIALADRLRHMSLKTQQIQQEMNEKLESRVAERTSELESANRQLEALSSTDGLTGVFNRRYFDARLAEEAARCRRQGPMALIMVDVDHFKSFNDSLGHQAGDACLQRLADTLTMVVRRGTDIVARYGGEEFAIILPYTDATGARALAEKVRATVERNLQFEWEGRPVAVTVSLGVAMAPGGTSVDPCELIAAADEALYASKQAGRNRVTVHSPGNLHSGTCEPVMP